MATPEPGAAALASPSSAPASSVPAASDPAAFDVDFFLDPMCPFAWQTSRWLLRVQQRRDLRIDWRFISLKLLHEHDADLSPRRAQSYETGFRYLRVLAAVRDGEGRGPIGDLYTAWGTRYWDVDADEVRARGGLGAVADSLDPAELLASVGVDPAYAAAADDRRWDEIVRADTELALDRAGRDVGTPVITYWPGGNSLFGPVISSVPDDDTAVAMYDALRTLVGFHQFSEIKRTNRDPLDLPALR